MSVISYALVNTYLAASSSVISTYKSQQSFQLVAATATMLQKDLAKTCSEGKFAGIHPELLPDVLSAGAGCSQVHTKIYTLNGQKVETMTYPNQSCDKFDAVIMDNVISGRTIQLLNLMCEDIGMYVDEHYVNTLHDFSGKVTICHNNHPITVDNHSIEAHLKHNDFIGDCSITNFVVTSTWSN